MVEIDKFLRWTFYIFIALITVMAGFYQACSVDKYLLLCFVFVPILIYLMKYFYKIPPLKLWHISVISVIIGGLWAVFVTATPGSDFKTYHNLAIALSQGEVAYNKYISTFPHIFGYGKFLSFFYSIFSSNLWVSKVINIALYTGINMLVYCIVLHLSNRQKATFAAVFLAIIPSQIMYISLICTEYLSLFLMLTFVFLYLKLKDKKLSYLYFLGLGILLGIMNIIRPLGLIIVCAVVLHSFCKGKIKVTNKILNIVALVITFLVTNNLLLTYVEKSINTPVARAPFGYNLYVGANYENNGAWNSQDAERFGDLSKQYPAQQAHDIMKNDAFERYQKLGVKNIFLMFKKYVNTWGADNAVVKYIENASPEKAFQNVENILNPLANSFYILLLILLLKHRNKNVNSFVILLFLGIVGLHTIAETMVRYHFPAISLLCILVFLGTENNASVNEEKTIKIDG